MKNRLSALLVAAASLVAFESRAAYGDVDPAYRSFPGGCSAIEPREDGGAYVQVFHAYQDPPGIIVARLDANGDPDTSWGTNGRTMYQALEFNRVMQFLRGKDGDLFVVDGGYAGHQNGITHFTADGHLDSAFGNGGRVAIPWSLGAALQPDGRIAVLVAENEGSVTMLRFTARGESDAAFGHGGALYVPGIIASPLASGNTRVYGWSIRSDGGVEIATYAYDATYAHIVPTLAVFSGDSFASTAHGSRLVPQGIATWMSPLAKVEPNGALVLAALFNRLSRFTPDGYEDTTFGPASYASGFGGISTVNALWREPNGEWTVVGTGEYNYGWMLVFDNYLRAVRIGANGAPDTAFGVKQFGSVKGQGEAVGHAADGKVLHAGSNCTLGRYLTDALRVEAPVVEYYHATLDHYFLTSSPNEIAGLDSNPLGWYRTGQTFGGWAPSDLPGSVRVCRFYGDPVIGPNSHFYTGQDFECQGLIALAAGAPPGVPKWNLEGRPMSLAIPAGGSCPANLAPVYRAFNGPAAGPAGPNHRYTTDKALYDAMLAKGWLAEGVHFCVPPAGR
jgi:uncharacterized delta-60 repeat protein